MKGGRNMAKFEFVHQSAEFRKTEAAIIEKHPVFKKARRSAERRWEEIFGDAPIPPPRKARPMDEEMAKATRSADVVTIEKKDLPGFSDSSFTVFARRASGEGENEPHIHVAGTTAGLHIDTCAFCGHDLRHEVHK